MTRRFVEYQHRLNLGDDVSLEKSHCYSSDAYPAPTPSLASSSWSWVRV